MKRPSQWLDLFEAAMVVECRGGIAAGHALFLETASIELVPVTTEHADAARRAWRRFGKGNHAAGLNFGDCQRLRRQPRKEARSSRSWD